MCLQNLVCQAGSVKVSMIWILICDSKFTMLLQGYSCLHIMIGSLYLSQYPVVSYFCRCSICTFSKGLVYLHLSVIIDRSYLNSVALPWSM